MLPCFLFRSLHTSSFYPQWILINLVSILRASNHRFRKLAFNYYFLKLVPLKISHRWVCHLVLRLECELMISSVFRSISTPPSNTRDRFSCFSSAVDPFQSIRAVWSNERSVIIASGAYGFPPTGPDPVLLGWEGGQFRAGCTGQVELRGYLDTLKGGALDQIGANRRRSLGRSRSPAPFYRLPWKKVITHHYPIEADWWRRVRAI